MTRRGIVSAGNMLVDHVHHIAHWPQPGWLVEIEHSQRATGGAPLNVLLTLARMETGLPAGGDRAYRLRRGRRLHHADAGANTGLMAAGCSAAKGR
ncbi:Uncharacterised protein [Serratia plymuthica]|uniref:Ribokinase n=1 Tax=Serratia plymuthica TaxID=82996 RepID=A0A2X4TYW8_SERPL|nr:Uncharacterised protein [Serratia plymuthica]